MKSSINFSFARFSLLCRQHWIYYGRLALVSILGLVAGLFVLLYSIQIITGFSPWHAGQFIIVFIWTFIFLAMAYAGSSFPGLRSRNRTYNYLLLPVSLKERFLFEVVNRILLFAIGFPILYWLVFHLEGNLVAALNPDFTFNGFSYFDPFKLPTQEEDNWAMVLAVTEGLLFLTVPFYGSTVFKKYPLIKTFAWASSVLFCHLVVFYFVHIGRIFPDRLTGMMMVAAYAFIINAAMLVLAYNKLKRKQI